MGNHAYRDSERGLACAGISEELREVALRHFPTLAIIKAEYQTCYKKDVFFLFFFIEGEIAISLLLEKAIQEYAALHTP